MDIVEKIIEELSSIPESDQAEVLDFVEYLKSKKRRKQEDEGMLRPALVIRELPGAYEDWLICMISS